MMSGSKAPDSDAYGLLRATHSHNPTPIFAYRGIIIPLLCSYRGGAQGLSPTYEQAHVGLDLLTLASYNVKIVLRFIFINKKSFTQYYYSYMINIMEYSKRRTYVL